MGLHLCNYRISLCFLIKTNRFYTCGCLWVLLFCLVLPSLVAWNMELLLRNSSFLDIQREYKRFLSKSLHYAKWVGLQINPFVDVYRSAHGNHRSHRGLKGWKITKWESSLNYIKVKWQFCCGAENNTSWSPRDILPPCGYTGRQSDCQFPQQLDATCFSVWSIWSQRNKRCPRHIPEHQTASS